MLLFQVKRQEHIYEFITNEKHHMDMLDKIQECFNQMQLDLNDHALEAIFPRLSELADFHDNFSKKLRQKQLKNYIVDSISDILLEFFSGLSAQRLRSAYGEWDIWKYLGHLSFIKDR